MTPPDVVTPEPDLPSLPLPRPGHRFTAFEHLRMAGYWFGSNFLWGALLGTVLSSQMTRLAPGDNAAVLGLLYAFGAFPALVIPLIAGPLSDRCTHPMGRRRPYVIGGIGGGLLGLALMALGYSILSLPAFFFGYLVLQLGSNVALAAYSGVIPDVVPDDQRGVASGFMAVMSQTGTLFGALMTSLVLDPKTEAGPIYLLIGAVFVIFGIITVRSTPEVPLPGPVPPFDWRKYFRSLWIDPKQHPDFAWVWITRALMMLGFYLIQPYLLYFVRDVIGAKEPAKSAGVAFALILVAATISGYFGGAISDRVGRKPVVIGASLVIAAMCLLFPFCRTMEHAVAVGLVFGLGYGAYISVDWALGTDVLPSAHDSGKDMAVWHVSMTLPQQIAPFTAGMVLSAFKSGTVVEDGKKVATYGITGYSILFVAAAIFFFLGGVLVRKVKKARGPLPR